FSPLSKLAINIETDLEGICSLKRIECRGYRLLTRNKQLERVPESGLLETDRKTFEIFRNTGSGLQFTLEAPQTWYVLPDKRHRRQEPHTRTNTQRECIVVVRTHRQCWNNCLLISRVECNHRNSSD